MGIVSDRKRKQRIRRIRRRLMIAFGVLALGAMAMAPGLREALQSAAQAVQTFGESAQAQITLPEREIFALQLAVFDSGERAADEARRLQREGVRCIVWQREKMRIVASAALAKEALDAGAARGREAYVIHDTLEEVRMQLTGGAAELERARTLLETPDSMFARLHAQDALADILADTRAAAAQAADAQHALVAQLAQSLVNWCALMEKTMEETDAQSARTYAQVTLCTLCRELRQALRSQSALPA